MDKQPPTASAGTQLSFTGVNGETRSYALVVYTYLYGLKGMGTYVHVPSSSVESVVPLVDSFSNRTILLVPSDAVGQSPPPPTGAQLNYNASFVILTEEYSLRLVSLNQPSSSGTLTYGGSGKQSASITVPDNDGIIIVTYKDPTTGQVGLVLSPWGIGSLGFTVCFGGNPVGQGWVTNDIRLVTIDGLAYQAKLALWNQQGTRGVS